MAETNHNRTPSGQDRRRSRATMSSSRRFSSQGEEDDYDLAAMGISDGFRPSAHSPTTHQRWPSSASHRDRRSTPPPRPSSTTKPRAVDNFALRDDGAMGTPSRPAVVAPSPMSGTITRSSSVSTDLPVIRAESPYQGPAGPSHPYHMYPQNTRIARTASISTTSTFQVPSERQYGGPLRPTHPYGMYAQNTIPEPEMEHDSVHESNIPVGFPGLGGQYQRRLGPEGEEAADIIGPLGHTEQLPPYTKYADETVAEQNSSSVPQLSGAGGIGLATRDPEFASREDLNSPLSRQSNRSMTSDSDHHINVAASGATEKPPEKRWKIIARKKVWNIVPVWVFVLVGLVFLGFCLIMGMVFGILSHEHKQSSSKSDPHYSESGTVSTVTTTYDALSLSAVPKGISDLPTGTFILPIATSIFSPQTCIDDASLSSAWSCAIPPSSIEMIVAPLPDSDIDTQCNEITIISTSLPMSYFYGSQPPIVSPRQVLSLVNDTQQTGFGPAWYFEIAYDKLVIVPERSLSVPSYNKRANRVHRGNSKGFSNLKSVAQAGDRPWFCYWNNTLLETFIYVNHTSGSGASEAAESSSMAMAVSSMGSDPSSASYASASSTAATAGAMISTAAATATLTPSSSSLSSSPSELPSPLQGYPKVVKVEERRVPPGSFSIPPYCVQMVILDNGAAVPAYGDDENMVVIYLNETEPMLPPSPEETASSTMRRRGSEGEMMEDSLERLVERDGISQCQCIWLSN